MQPYNDAHASVSSILQQLWCPSRLLGQGKFLVVVMDVWLGQYTATHHYLWGSQVLLYLRLMGCDGSDVPRSWNHPMFTTRYELTQTATLHSLV